MSVRIIRGQLEHPKVQHFIQAHLTQMHQQSPPQSVHAIGITSLQSKDIQFWGIWEKDQIVACGALKVLNHTHGEIKSMRSAPEHRGQGLGKMILTHIIDQAKRLGMQRLSLETGTQAEFSIARMLYAKHGFQVCEPFANYQLDVNSVFMTKTL